MNFNILVRRIINTTKNLNRPFAVIDGENFKYLPIIKRIDILGEKSEDHNIIMISKSSSILKQYENFSFCHNIQLCNVMSNHLIKNSTDDALCIALTNKLFNLNYNVKLYSNDKYRDFNNIRLEKDSLVNYLNQLYYFSPYEELKDISYQNILTLKNHTNHLNQ